jgi:NADH-quinone oxidoreductase subunit F
LTKIKIKVGMASCGRAAGADKIYQKIESYIKEKNIDASVEETGCIGMCFREPLFQITSNENDIIYGDLTEHDVPMIIDAFVEGNPIHEKAILTKEFDAPENKNLATQTRIVLRNCGRINPESIEDYIQNDGYKALEKALKNMTREEVIAEIKSSGLRGRGGAGFPTGLKWEFAYKAKSDKKYIVCNADEGDPGAFMDRSVLEGDPHSILEGMAIGAYAIGADEGYVYCRAEYPLAVKRINLAIKDAEKKGLLGNNILGTNFSFHLKLKEGAGAFVCGEETALIASIEGKRGMPRIRPPFPAQSGIWGKPTNINNVETFANIAWIINKGASEFSKYGTEKSKGTKVFALAGKIKKSGLVEVPIGMTLREVIYDIGGGMKTEKDFKAVQLGGPSGGCIPKELLDTKIDYDTIQATGAIMGSGGMVVMDESTCMIDVAKFFLSFVQSESCGKCTFCRIGSKRMLEILDKISKGEGKMEDITTLKELAVKVKDSSLCGLGQTAPNPVLTTLKYFEDEYIAHIVDKKCPAGVCTNLLTYEIQPDKCVGCGMCAKVCPVDAISGEIKKVFEIDQSKCIKCGACFSTCKFNAIEKK